MTFKVDKDGWYQCRNPEWVAHVVVAHDLMEWSVTGFIYHDNAAASVDLWHSDGRYLFTEDNQKDLITYLGTERPKQKRKVKMAPALLSRGELGYWITDRLYESEEQIKSELQHSQSKLIRWLIDTHALEVEVDDA